MVLWVFRCWNMNLLLVACFPFWFFFLFQISRYFVWFYMLDILVVDLMKFLGNINYNGNFLVAKFFMSFCWNLKKYVWNYSAEFAPHFLYEYTWNSQHFLYEYSSFTPETVWKWNIQIFFLYKIHKHTHNNIHQ